MNNTQRLKSKFRRSKKWKLFRMTMKKKNKVDFLTGYPLRSGWNLHHMDLNFEHYEMLSEENFCCLNRMTHELVHDLYRYYVNDESILLRLQALLQKMKEINS